MLKRSKEIFDILSKGGFLSLNSVVQANRNYYDVIEDGFDAYRDYIAAHAGDGVWALCFDGEEAQLPVPAISYGKEGDGISEAHNLFTVLRELDRKGAKTVYARCPLSDGVSMAVYNRLIRAAAFRVVEV